LAPEDEAERAWAAWSSVRNFERVSIAEVRLLAAFSERIARLDPSSPLLPRLDGLAKLQWTRARLTLVQTAEAFDGLARASIPFLIFKGGALLAEDFAPSRRRVIGDVDILVPREFAVQAVDSLTDDGWSSVNGESPAYLRRLANVRISGNYRKGRHGNLDLHITPFHFARANIDLDQGLWGDARVRSLAGRDVLVPDAADAIVISLAHAPIGSSVEWALDIVTRVAHQPIDWDRILYITEQRGLVPSSLSGLRYLREALSAPIPASVLARLETAPVTFGAWLKFRSNLADRKDRNLADKAVNRVADRLLRRDSYTYFVKDSVAVTVARPSVLPVRLGWSRQSVPLSSSGLGIRHEFLVPSQMAGRRLGIEIAVLQPGVSRRIFFDVTANGVAIARLRCRLGPPPGIERSLTFFLSDFRCNGLDTRISIDARPTGYLLADAPQADRAERGAIQFRLVKVTV
jgi:hypothetical protein